MATEEMIVMALKYDASQKPLGYTFFRKPSDGSIIFGTLIAIYDKEGKSCPKEDFIRIQIQIISEYQRLHREKIKYEKSIKNI